MKETPVDIRIDDRYRITADANQWILQRLSGTYLNKKTQEMEDSWQSIGYYTDIGNLFRELVLRKVRLSGASSIEELVKSLTEECQRLSGVLAPVLHVGIDRIRAA